MKTVKLRESGTEKYEFLDFLNFDFDLNFLHDFNFSCIFHDIFFYIFF